MNRFIEVGEVNTLKINRVAEPGLYLIAKDEEEVLLPNAYIESSMNIGDLLEVFIYTDSEDRLVATTKKPYALKNEFSFLEVVDLAKFGAFVDIGLPKDILVPKNRQKSTFNVGDYKVVQLLVDDKTNRMIATEKFKFKKLNVTAYQRNDEVNILVHMKTPLGFKVVVDNLYEGLVYHNEVFQKLSIGDRKRAFVKLIREDGKLDISLQKIGEKASDENQNKILEQLEQNGGELEFTYKSDAEEIKEQFSMSKKVFKASLTKLVEASQIELLEKSIKLK